MRACSFFYQFSMMLTLHQILLTFWHTRKWTNLDSFTFFVRKNFYPKWSAWKCLSFHLDNNSLDIKNITWIISASIPIKYLKYIGIIIGEIVISKKYEKTKQIPHMEYVLHSCLFSLLSTIWVENKILFIFLASMIITIEVNKRKKGKWNDAAIIQSKWGLLHLVVLLWKKIAHPEDLDK